jgi:4-amino-4-deoxy-L-arabinose transferase-like glycosyltransferase
MVVRFYRRGALWYMAAAGVLLGLGALTRSVLWMAPPFLALFVLLTWRASLPRRLLAAGLMVAAFAVTLAPWSVRNTRLEQTFVAVDTMGGRNFMMGNYEYTPLYSSWAAIDVGIRHPERGWDNMVRDVDPSFAQMTQGQRDKRALKYGLDFMKNNPGLTAQRDLIKSIQFWGLERELIAGASRGYFGSLLHTLTPALAVVILGAYVFAMFSSIFGMLIAPPQDRRLHLFFLLVLAFVWGMHALVFAHSRYHLPLMPLVLMYSASALVHARAIWQRRNRPAFWLAAGACALLAAGWAWVDIAVYLGAV